MKRVKHEELIKRAVKKKRIILGYKKVVKMLKLHSDISTVILAKNTPPEMRREIEHLAKLSQTPVEIFDGSGNELGSICGKPFPVTVVGIIKG